jgi:hypothetical protein
MKTKANVRVVMRSLYSHAARSVKADFSHCAELCGDHFFTVTKSAILSYSALGMIRRVNRSLVLS